MESVRVELLYLIEYERRELGNHRDHRKCVLRKEW